MDVDWELVEEKEVVEAMEPPEVAAAVGEWVSLMVEMGLSYSCSDTMLNGYCSTLVFY